jgi:hypothetical protein
MNKLVGLAIKAAILEQKAALALILNDPGGDSQGGHDGGKHEAAACQISAAGAVAACRLCYMRSDF